jgi:hypothetical protein
MMSSEGDWPFAGSASNNGMHPTPHHGVSHEPCVGARVMPGVMLLLLSGNGEEILRLQI